MTATMLPFARHAEKLTIVPVDSITVVDRHRKDMGDLDSLASSMEAEGLLQPIGITPENVLVFGERRLRAAEQLGWKKIAARVVQVSSIVAGEYAENEVRKDFTPSERVAIGDALERRLGDRRGKCQNFDTLKGQRTSEVAAKKAGFGNRTTYDQARRVVEQAVEEVREQMDSGKLAISSAALIAEQPKARQKEIAEMPGPQQKEVVREIRREQRPSPQKAHEQAKALGPGAMVLDSKGVYQTPTPMKERLPLIERNMMIAEFFTEGVVVVASGKLSPAELAEGLKGFDSPDKDYRGKCVTALAVLKELVRLTA